MVKVSDTQNKRNYNLRDDFAGKVDLKIWSLQRLSNHNWKTVKYKGKNAVKITVNKGDYRMVGNDGKFTERAELSEKESVWIPTRTLIWYSFSFYLPQDFKILKNRLVFAQWKQSTVRSESPFLSFRYVDGKLYFQVVFDSQRKKYFCKQKDWRGKWHKVLVYFKLEKSHHGETKAWVDGELIAKYKGRLGSSSPTSDPHFKFGLYRDQIEVPQTIYLANFRRSSMKEYCQ